MKLSKLDKDAPQYLTNENENDTERRKSSIKDYIVKNYGQPRQYYGFDLNVEKNPKYNDFYQYAKETFIKRCNVESDYISFERKQYEDLKELMDLCSGIQLNETVNNLKEKLEEILNTSIDEQREKLKEDYLRDLKSKIDDWKQYVINKHIVCERIAQKEYIENDNITNASIRTLPGILREDFSQFSSTLVTTPEYVRVNDDIIEETKDPSDPKWGKFKKGLVFYKDYFKTSNAITGVIDEKTRKTLGISDDDPELDKETNTLYMFRPITTKRYIQTCMATDGSNEEYFIEFEENELAVIAKKGSYNRYFACGTMQPVDDKFRLLDDVIVIDKTKYLRSNKPNEDENMTIVKAHIADDLSYTIFQYVNRKLTDEEKEKGVPVLDVKICCAGINFFNKLSPPKSMFPGVTTFLLKDFPKEYLAWNADLNAPSTVNKLRSKTGMMPLYTINDSTPVDYKPEGYFFGLKFEGETINVVDGKLYYTANSLADKTLEAYPFFTLIYCADDGFPTPFYYKRGHGIFDHTKYDSEYGVDVNSYTHQITLLDIENGYNGLTDLLIGLNESDFSNKKMFGILNEKEFKIIKNDVESNPPVRCKYAPYVVHYTKPLSHIDPNTTDSLSKLQRTITGFKYFENVFSYLDSIVVEDAKVPPLYFESTGIVDGNIRYDVHIDGIFRIRDIYYDDHEVEGEYKYYVKDFSIMDKEKVYDFVYTSLGILESDLWDKVMGYSASNTYYNTDYNLVPEGTETEIRKILKQYKAFYTRSIDNKRKTHTVKCKPYVNFNDHTYYEQKGMRLFACSGVKILLLPDVGILVCYTNKLFDKYSPDRDPYNGTYSTLKNEYQSLSDSINADFKNRYKTEVTKGERRCISSTDTLNHLKDMTKFGLIPNTYYNHIVFKDNESTWFDPNATDCGKITLRPSLFEYGDDDTLQNNDDIVSSNIYHNIKVANDSVIFTIHETKKDVPDENGCILSMETFIWKSVSKYVPTCKNWGLIYGILTIQKEMENEPGIRYLDRMTRRSKDEIISPLTDYHSRIITVPNVFDSSSDGEDVNKKYGHTSVVLTPHMHLKATNTDITGIDGYEINKYAYDSNCYCQYLKGVRFLYNRIDISKKNIDLSGIDKEKNYDESFSSIATLPSLHHNTSQDTRCQHLLPTKDSWFSSWWGENSIKLRSNDDMFNIYCYRFHENSPNYTSLGELNFEEMYSLIFAKNPDWWKGSSEYSRNAKLDGCDRYDGNLNDNVFEFRDGYIFKHLFKLTYPYNKKFDGLNCKKFLRIQDCKDLYPDHSVKDVYDYMQPDLNNIITDMKTVPLNKQPHAYEILYGNHVKIIKDGTDYEIENELYDIVLPLLITNIPKIYTRQYNDQYYFSPDVKARFVHNYKRTHQTDLMSFKSIDKYFNNTHDKITKVNVFKERFNCLELCVANSITTSKVDDLQLITKEYKNKQQEFLETITYLCDRNGQNISKFDMRGKIGNTVEPEKITGNVNIRENVIEPLRFMTNYIDLDALPIKYSKVLPNNTYLVMFVGYNKKLYIFNNSSNTLHESASSPDKYIVDKLNIGGVETPYEIASNDTDPQYTPFATVDKTSTILDVKLNNDTEVSKVFFGGIRKDGYKFDAKIPQYIIENMYQIKYGEKVLLELMQHKSGFMIRQRIEETNRELYTEWRDLLFDDEGLKNSIYKHDYRKFKIYPKVISETKYNIYFIDSNGFLWVLGNANAHGELGIGRKGSKEEKYCAIRSIVGAKSLNKKPKMKKTDTDVTFDFFSVDVKTSDPEYYGQKNGKYCEFTDYQVTNSIPFISYEYADKEDGWDTNDPTNEFPLKSVLGKKINDIKFGEVDVDGGYSVIVSYTTKNGDKYEYVAGKNKGQNVLEWTYIGEQDTSIDAPFVYQPKISTELLYDNKDIEIYHLDHILAGNKIEIILDRKADKAYVRNAYNYPRPYRPEQLFNYKPTIVKNEVPNVYGRLLGPEIDHVAEGLQGCTRYYKWKKGLTNFKNVAEFIAIKDNKLDNGMKKNRYDDLKNRDESVIGNYKDYIEKVFGKLGNLVEIKELKPSEIKSIHTYHGGMFVLYNDGTFGIYGNNIIFNEYGSLGINDYNINEYKNLTDIENSTCALEADELNRFSTEFIYKYVKVPSLPTGVKVVNAMYDRGVLVLHIDDNGSQEVLISTPIITDIDYVDNIPTVKSYMNLYLLDCKEISLPNSFVEIHKYDKYDIFKGFIRITNLIVPKKYKGDTNKFFNETDYDLKGIKFKREEAYGNSLMFWFISRSNKSDTLITNLNVTELNERLYCPK